ncbi:MAG: hypothetical protein CM1200mP2_03450 [Planctomycetaceae bacterium]|nr:MAG: hypothetical protein CM1200mP2_03450 [Planctomycetaceae bacterium]
MGVSVSQSGKRGDCPRCRGRTQWGRHRGAGVKRSSGDVEPLEHHVPYGITGDRKAGQPPPGGGQ